MTDDPDIGTDLRGSLPGAGQAVAEAELRLRGSLDLSEITRLVLDTTVPDFADAAAVFAVERLFQGGGGPVRSDDTCEITARRLGTRIAYESQRATQETFPAGEVIAFAGGSPYARCVRGAGAVVFDRPDSQTLERTRGRGREMMSRYGSFLAVPAVGDTRAAGFLAFARTAGLAFGDADVTAATRLADGAGIGITNALTLLRERSLADTLQDSLLGTEPSVPPGIEVAARCLPAAGQAVGGDWYDIVPLPGGRSGLIIGDVMGHGPEAAAVMAQLRAAAHALAQLDPEPAELLGHLNRTTATLRRPVLATCVYAVLDPAGRSCTLSAAGHLPPVLAMPDGATRVPALPTGQSLGLGPAAYGQARMKLPPGAIIALYTDGLVETRTRSFDDGILALCAALSDWHGPLEAACDTLVASLAQRHEDDVTVVLARIPPPEPPGSEPAGPQPGSGPAGRER